MRLSKLRAITSVVIAGAIVGSGCLFTADPAYASTNWCGGDVCAKVLYLGGGQVQIEMWAYDMNFLGHFQIFQPDGTEYNCPTSGNDEWLAGKEGCVEVLTDESGDYVAKAWEWIEGNDYKRIGYVKFPD
jgi:hypothetical protein